MTSDKRSSFEIDLSAPGLLVTDDPVSVDATELLELVREEFAQQGDVIPCDEKLLALARVATGFLRTSPLLQSATPQGQIVVVQAFVATCLGWWTRDFGAYGKVAALLDDVFHQRETHVPDAATMDMLLALTVGLLRRRRIDANASVAQLAITDWLATLYLAGLEDW